jgi:hypothetical protein
MMDIYTKRFLELEQDLEAIGKTKIRKHLEYFGDNDFIDQEMLDTVKVKIKSLISSLCTKDSDYFEAFEDAEKIVAMDSNYDVYTRIKSVFTALKDDYLNGYIVKYRSIIQAEVFSDQIDQAQELLNNNYYVASAIITGIVLETKLREIIIANGMDIGKLDKMNADLCKNGIYNSLMQKQITAIAAIRNSAAHGKYDEFTPEQVQNMIGQVTQIVSNL